MLIEQVHPFGRGSGGVKLGRLLVERIWTQYQMLLLNDHVGIDRLGQSFIQQMLSEDAILLMKDKLHEKAT
jgi:hypothetical protein